MAEARIIELAPRPRSAALASYAGESIGRWDGDALVIETARLRPDPAAPPADRPAERRVTERLHFTSPDEIAYAYTVDDPDVLSSPMKVEFTLVRTRSRMFEASCHEGNYSMTGILRGARVVEQRESASKR
jgi:hypothetical protein